ncbi:MAG: hypothetical protein AAGC49_05350 [Brevundimonas sp.]
MSNLQVADPASPPVHDDIDPATEAMSAVRLGIWVSATRCVLTYVVAPAAGAIGIFLGPFGLLLQLLAAVTATSGARNLWALGHRLRYVYAFVAVAVDAVTALALVRTLGAVIR